MTDSILTRLNQRLIKSSWFRYEDIIDHIGHKTFNVEQIVNSLLLLRDEARYVKQEDKRYAYVVSRVLKLIYNLLQQEYWSEWKQIWDIVDKKEKINVMPNHQYIANVLGTRDTNGKHINL
jgi:hypothetical protein